MTRLSQQETPAMSSEPSVLILGLDGATFDLMLPWIDQGHLPALGGLIQRGSWSRLRSTIPPHTPCAWSSFLTGKNPGKHGLFEFSEPISNSYEFRFTNASSRHGESLWSILSRAEKRVGVVNVPMTYPPEPVNGYLIAGLDTPHQYSPFTYPDDLRRELLAMGYQIDLQHMGNMRTDARRDQLLRELCDMESTRTRALEHLRRRQPSDFSMIVYTATDRVQHHFWHYMDPKHDKYDMRGSRRYEHAIRDVYVHLDRLIVGLLDQLDENTVVIIMSDHGFGPSSNVRLRLNQALANQGLLRFAQNGHTGRAMRGAAGILDKTLRSWLSPRAKHLLAGMFPGLRAWFENLDEAKVDWTQTMAYTNEAYRTSPAIWLNRSGVKPHGTVSSGPELDRVMDATISALTDLIDPQTGGPVVSNVYRTRDLYAGPYVGNAPDLLPSWWEDGFLLEQSRPGKGSEIAARRSADPIEGGVEFTGSHRLDGVFVMAGGPAKQAHAFTGAEIIDIAPTVLYLMGLPIPSDMDGRPLLEAIEPEFVSSRPPEYEHVGEPDRLAERRENDSFTKQEEELVAERLRSLGYIE
jgi:predicted AlkP superfamily phosphohydrolase/phosphomutase